MTGDTTFSNRPAISLLPVAGIYGILLASNHSSPCPKHHTLLYVALVRPSPPHRDHIYDSGQQIRCSLHNSSIHSILHSIYVLRSYCVPGNVFLRKTKRWTTVAALSFQQWNSREMSFFSPEKNLSLAKLLCAFSLDSVSCHKCIHKFFHSPH